MFYMWEPANPRERADFEEDLIASTNENLYLTTLPFKTNDVTSLKGGPTMMTSFAEERHRFLFQNLLFDPDDFDLGAVIDDC